MSCEHNFNTALILDLPRKEYRSAGDSATKKEIVNLYCPLCGMMKTEFNLQNKLAIAVEALEVIKLRCNCGTAKQALKEIEG